MLTQMHWMPVVGAMVLGFGAAAAFADGGYRLENKLVRIAFDDLGQVVQIHNKQTGVDYLLTGAEPVSPFVIDAYSAHQSFFIDDYQEKQNGGFSQADPRLLDKNPGDLVRLKVDPAKPPTAKQEGDRIEFAYELPSGISLTYTVTLPADSEVSQWQVHVANGLPELPKDQLRVYRVAFPVLGNLCIAGQPANNFLARPYAQGELAPNPSQQSLTMVLTYPGWASMPWMDLYGHADDRPNAISGLYLASYDPTFQQIDLEAVPNNTRVAVTTGLAKEAILGEQPEVAIAPAGGEEVEEVGTMTLDVRTYAYTEPEQQWQSQKFIVGVHTGDWHWAGDRYRADSKAWLKERDVPEWVGQCDGWFGSGGRNYKYRDLPKMYEQAQWLGLDYLQVWSEMIEPLKPDGKRKFYYCFFLPDPDRGGEEGMTEGVRKVRQMGGHIGFYTNLWTFDASLPRDLLPWKDRIPADTPIPDWNKEFRRYASVFPDGHIEPGAYPPHGYAGMCPGARGWRDYMKFWIVDKYVKQYGVDTWYIDSCPVTMFGAARVCFSLEHGDEHPHGVGRSIIELVRTLRQTAKETTDLAVTMETVSDVLMQYGSHALGIELVRGVTDFPKPEVYTFTFPHHPIFSGTCNSWKGVTKYYTDMPKPTHEDALNRVFLIGYRFDVIGYPLKKDSVYWQYVRDLIGLRQRIKGDLYASSFRDDLGIGPLPDKVEAKVFRHDEGRSLTVTIVDRREHKAEMALTLDAATLDVDGMQRATLYTFDGQELEAKVVQEGEALRLTVPARLHNAAAVIVRK